MLFLVVLLFAAISPSYQVVYSCNPYAECGCSVNPVSISRIVGGEGAGFATWAWAVSIAIDNEFLCAGSIISSSWVITAAHCVSGNRPSQVTIYAGSILPGSGTQKRFVSQIIVHPSYISSTYENDIALLRLDYSLSMSDRNVGTICMPSVSSTTLAAGEWPPAGIPVVAIGWGRLSENGPPAAILQQVTLSTVDYRDSTCSVMIYDKRVQFCAGVFRSSKDTCQGDSGGPLMMFSSSNQWVLVGLTSFGNGCARPGYAGVYTRVAAYQNWIRSNTNDSSQSVPFSNANTMHKLVWSLLLSVGLILMF